jgi:alpha-beta hydrolase superfamily lysophospholipase
VGKERITFVDGLARTVRVWGPERAPGFLLLHGIESHGGWWEAVGSGLAARGFRASAFDRAGWGESPGERGDAAGARAILAEILAARAALGVDAKHIVGLSWGGVPAALAENAASITLIAPALYPARKLALADYAKAALGVGRVHLPLAIADFTRRPEQQAFIAQDAARVTDVSGRFLRATYELMLRARAARQTAPIRQVLLAGDDNMVDNAKTRAWAARAGYAVHEKAGAAHSLVLEDPAWVVERLCEAVR